MKKTIMIISMIFISSAISNNLQAQALQAWVNPGIKVGYEFGKSGGLVLGFELSVTQGMVGGAGIVFDYDYLAGHKAHKLFLGAQANLTVAGLCIGPSLLIKGNKHYWGKTIIPYVGILGYLYYNYTSFEKYRKPVTKEMGGYLKAPIFVGHNDFSLSG